MTKSGRLETRHFRGQQCGVGRPDSVAGTPAMTAGFRRNRLPLFLLAISTLAVGCDPYRVVKYDSSNQDSRVDYVVIHFTSGDFAESLRQLTQPSSNPVSSHYLIPESDDPGYTRRRLQIHQLVPENRRAWHAGRSAWAEKVELNDGSIGIELVNVSRCAYDDPHAAGLTPVEEACEFRDFDEAQIDLLIVVVRDILERYPDLDPVDVVGHADIAPARKVDPGPTFPWKRLYDEGIGAWYDAETVEKYRERFRDGPPDIETMRQGLKLYGYPVAACGGMDIELQQVLRAFQMHFVPDAISLQPDAETAALLFALLEKYRDEQFADLGKDSAC